MALEDFIVDPYKPQPYAATPPPVEEEDVSSVPITAVDDPWSSIKGEERGVSLQEEGTTGLGDQFTHGEYDVPSRVSPAAKYNAGPGMTKFHGGNKPPSWQSAAIRTGVMGATTAAIGAYTSGGRGAVTVGVAEGGGGTYQQSGGGYGGQGGGVGASNLMSAYAGYQASPYGAMFEQEYMGGYSPGYVGAGATSPIFTMVGGRNDKEARQSRGQRIGMSGAGAIAGAMGGGGWGAVYGAAGAQFQENPYSGKRGYQEEWKYNIKPAGKGAWADIESHSWGKGPMVKGGTMRSTTNMENWKDNARYSVPGMGGLGGGGKAAPAKSEVKRDIAHMLSGQVTKDFQIQEWWNTVANQGAQAGREYIQGGLKEEGRSFVTDETMPEWAQGERAFGKGDHMYQYGPEEIDGRRVSSKGNVGTLAALQGKMEEMGSRKQFWQKYMQDYNMFSEGGKGYTDRWKGKDLYSLPSEIYGKTNEEMWSDIDFTKDYNDLDWLKMQEEEESV